MKMGQQGRGYEQGRGNDRGKVKGESRSKGNPGKRGEEGDENLKCIALQCFAELSHTKLYTFVFSLQICRYQLHSNS